MLVAHKQIQIRYFRAPEGRHVCPDLHTAPDGADEIANNIHL